MHLIHLHILKNAKVAKKHLHKNCANQLKKSNMEIHSFTPMGEKLAKIMEEASAFDIF